MKTVTKTQAILFEVAAHLLMSVEKALKKAGASQSLINRALYLRLDAEEMAQLPVEDA